MDKEIQDFLQQVRESGRAAYWQGTPESARARPTLMQALFGPAPQVARTEELAFRSADGTRVGARLYVPPSETLSEPGSLIVYFHGGGWVVGSVEGYHPFNADLARRTGCAVLAVDYRLAPEHPFPLPLQDAVAALEFAAANACAWLGGEPEALIAFGDSAGAALATMAAREHNASGCRRVDLQVLVYPICDVRFDTGSYETYQQGFLLTRRDMQWFWDLYCPDRRVREAGQCAPMQQDRLAGSPNALIVTAECDPLRDEGEAYAARLREHGVPAELIRGDGLVHGFLSMVHWSPSAGNVYAQIVERIKRAATRGSAASA